MINGYCKSLENDIPVIAKNFARFHELAIAKKKLKIYEDFLRDLNCLEKKCMELFELKVGSHEKFVEVIELIAKLYKNLEDNQNKYIGKFCP